MKKKVGVVGYGGMGQWHVCSIAGTTYLNAIDFNESALSYPLPMSISLFSMSVSRREIINIGVSTIIKTRC